MRYAIILFIIFLCQHSVEAQEFIELDTILPFPGAAATTLVYVDVDGDHDEDLLLSGWDSPDYYTKLVINQGDGYFIENLNVPFEQVSGGDIAVADIDGDEDQDILVCGRNVLFEVKTSLYINQGNGIFLEDTANTLEDISNGEVAFCDVDDDGDQDVIVVGQNEDFADIAKLYLNNGAGAFEELPGTPFVGVRFTAIAIADIDHDLDQDIVISGRDSLSKPNTQLYKNQGSGVFERVENSNLHPVFEGSMAFSDIDGDADPDLLLTGWAVAFIAKLYINNGEGVFNEAGGQNFPGVKAGSVVFEDFDNDEDEDLLITGLNASLNSEAQMYLNDGTGNFINLITPIVSIYEGAAAFSDIDADNDPDLLMIGRNSETGLISKQYINEAVVSSVSITKEGPIDLKIFPNPAQNHVKIDAPELDVFNIEIYSTDGKIMSQWKNTFHLNVSTIAEGLYYLRIVSNSFNMIKPLIISRQID